MRNDIVKVSAATITYQLTSAPVSKAECLVYSIHDSTEIAIQKMIDASRRMIDVQSKVTGEARKDGWGINPIMKKHLESEIKTHFKMPLEMQITCN
jgi:hypothetical protein